jgi:tetratricopeptide (TPR) repeat protein
MIGYNSRETFQDATYDVQTQQLSSPERSIETHVYRNGKIVATVCSVTAEDAPIEALEERMSQQHEEICGKVREGTYELVFLWISRGIIAFESEDYLQALECFESVLAMEETHAEANTYLGKIQDSLKKNAPSRRRVLEGYQRQIEELESSNRIMEASRKRAILTRICETPPPKDPAIATKRQPNAEPMPRRSFLENPLARFREHLLPSLREGRLADVAKELLVMLREYLFLPIQQILLPKIRDTVLPKVRGNLYSKYVLVTLATLLLTILSGLIAADFQVKLDPAYHASLGQEYLEGNRISPARNLFYGILRQDPASLEAIDGLWKTFEKEGDYHRAADMLAALVENHESAPQIHFYLAEAFRLTSRYAEAVPQYEKSMERGFSEVSCKIGIGLCLAEQENLQAAIDLWEELVQNGSEDYRVDYCLGRAYQASGRLGRASVHYSRALQKRPDASPIYRALGDCLYGLHQQEKAEGLWNKAASLDATVGTERPCPEGRRSVDGSSNASAGNCFPFPLI